MSIESLEGSRLLMFASTGGHLAQLIKWADRLELDPESLIVTFDSSQSRSLLRSRPHVFVPYIAPRDFRGTWAAARELRKGDFGGFQGALSTGAAIAVAGLSVARKFRLPFTYIESVSRFAGPSTTGRLLEFVPGVTRYAQHPGYDPRRWIQAPSLLSNYEVEVGPDEALDRPLKVFVTLGTIAPYRFDRMIDAIAPVLREGDSITWQTGSTERTDLVGRPYANIDRERFDELVREADVVFTHGGVGSLLGILEANKLPLVMARRRSFHEHVDDHQMQVVTRLSELGLAHEVVQGVNREDLLKIASARVSTVGK